MRDIRRDAQNMDKERIRRLTKLTIVSLSLILIYGMGQGCINPKNFPLRGRGVNDKNLIYEMDYSKRVHRHRNGRVTNKTTHRKRTIQYNQNKQTN
ncbi:MAG: hypothetical protein [Microviridae sp.]|nr:MAG: hypothetical protein [Microviridae sp.]